MVYPFHVVVKCGELSRRLVHASTEAQGSGDPLNYGLWPENALVDVPLPAGGYQTTYFGWLARETSWRTVAGPFQTTKLSFSVVDAFDDSAITFEEPFAVEIRIRQRA